MRVFAVHTIAVELRFPIGFQCPDNSTEEQIKEHIAESCRGFARQWLEQEEYDEMKPDVELKNLGSEISDKQLGGEQDWWPGRTGDEPWCHDETPEWIKESIEDIVPTVIEGSETR